LTPRKSPRAGENSRLITQVGKRKRNKKVREIWNGRGGDVNAEGEGTLVLFGGTRKVNLRVLTLLEEAVKVTEKM